MKNLLLLKILLQILIIAGPFPLLGQQDKFSWRLGVQAGAMSYFGDLTEEFRLIQPTKETIQLLRDLDHLGYGFSLEGSLSRTWGIGLAFHTGQFTNNDRRIDWNNELQMDGTNFGRSLNALTELDNYSLYFHYYFDNEKLLGKSAFLAPYFKLGAGFTKYKVLGDLYFGDQERYYYWPDGTVRTGPEGDAGSRIISQDGIFETDLTELETEGESYETSTLTPTVGLGLKFRLSSRLNLNLEYAFYFTQTDYLDDVSDQFRSEYPNEMVEYAANPAGIDSEFRGNPNGKKDFYNFASLSLHYNFSRKREAFTAPVIRTGYLDLQGSGAPLADNPAGQVATKDSLASPVSEMEVKGDGKGQTPNTDEGNIVATKAVPTNQKATEAELEAELAAGERMSEDSLNLDPEATVTSPSRSTEAELAAELELAETTARAAQEQIADAETRTDSAAVTEGPKPETVEILKDSITQIEADSSQIIKEITSRDSMETVQQLPEVQAAKELEVKNEPVGEIRTQPIDSVQVKATIPIVKDTLAEKRIQALEQELSRIKARQDSIKGELDEELTDEYEMKIEALEEEIDSLKSNLKQPALLQMEKSQEDEMTLLREELRDLKGQLEDQPSPARPRSDSEEAEIKALRAKVEAYEAQLRNRDRQQNADQYEELKSAIEELKQEVKNKQSDIIAPLDPKEEQIKALSAQIDSLNQKIENQIRDTVAVDPQIAALQQQLLQMQQQLQAQEEQRRQEKAEAERLAEQERLNAAEAKRLAEEAKRREEEANRQAEIDALRTELDLLKAKEAEAAAAAKSAAEASTLLKAAIAGKELQLLYFPLGAASVSPAMQLQLQEIVDLLQRHSRLRVQLQGFSDKSGDATRNIQLADRRAAAIRQYLVQAGIGAERINLIKGNIDYAVKNPAEGRRVELKLLTN